MSISTHIRSVETVFILLMESLILSLDFSDSTIPFMYETNINYKNVLVTI